MNLYIDQNGWTVHIDNFDPRIVTQDELELLRTLPYTNVLVAIHDLPALTSEEYQEFCHKVFYQVQNDLSVHDRRFLPGHNREILQVTGRRNESGEIIGIFGMPEFLPWHCNQPGLPFDRRPDCLTLYSVEGCKGSVTAYTNSVLALKDLRVATNAPEGLLENLDKLNVYYSYSIDLDEDTSNTNYNGPQGKHPLVIKNKAGIDGILFSNQTTESFYIDDVKISKEIYQLWHNYLCKFLTQKKYVYGHAWKNNEMTMNCQLLGQHARLPFTKIHERLLWRVMGIVEAFDGTSVNLGELPVYQRS